MTKLYPLMTIADVAGQWQLVVKMFVNKFKHALTWRAKLKLKLIFKINVIRIRISNVHSYVFVITTQQHHLIEICKLKPCKNIKYLNTIRTTVNIITKKNQIDIRL